MIRILFIGNSHTYFNDMPRMVQELAAAQGIDTRITMLTQGGKTLDWHASQQQTSFNLRYGNYDFCVLQQAAHPFDGYKALAEGTRKIRDLIPENPPRFVLYMTWAEKEKPFNQPEMTEAYRKTAAEQNLLLAPVGERFVKFRSLCPQIELYFKDGAHASQAGSLLAACTILEAITGKKPSSALPEAALLLKKMEPELVNRIIRFSAEEAE